MVVKKDATKKPDKESPPYLGEKMFTGLMGFPGL